MKLRDESGQAMAMTAFGFGILLAFMFIWNMVGALVLLPALASFLLRGPARAA